MNIRNFDFKFEEYSNTGQLDTKDRELLEAARAATNQSFAPYSQFKVGAAALLGDGQVILGSNQESAAFPAGICAERALLASLAQLSPNAPIQSMAVTYENLKGDSNLPVTPCGICRQVMAEYEIRTASPIRLILSGITGPVYIIPSVAVLLPLGFQLAATG